MNSLKRKKQNFIAKSNAENEYQGTALTTCELICLKHQLQELCFCEEDSMNLICNKPSNPAHCFQCNLS